MSRRVAGWAGVLLLVVYSASGSSPVRAESPQSPHYQLEEATIGSGGLIQSSSKSYNASSATGDLAVGETSSDSYKTETGSQTTREPTLSFTVDTAKANFGNFTAGGATTTTATFSVTNYTSYGYVVHIAGKAPTNGEHTIDAMATTDTSKPGIEQFGINLVANTDPTSVGANPKNDEFGFGEATTNYSTSNQYRYVSGETIAKAPKSSGETLYTLSYLVNVASLTPGGQYTSDQTLIVTGTY